MTNRNTLKVKRLHPDAKLPTKAHATDAGWDIYAPCGFPLFSDEMCFVETSLAMEIPKGFYGDIRPRSSLFKKGIVVSGVVDSDFRGNVVVVMRNLSGFTIDIKEGDRIAQMLLLPVPEFEVVEVPDGAELSETSRGSGGFGSSGR